MRYGFVCLFTSLMSFSLTRMWLLTDSNVFACLCSPVLSRAPSIQLTCRKLCSMNEWMDSFREEVIQANRSSHLEDVCSWRCAGLGQSSLPDSKSLPNSLSFAFAATEHSWTSLEELVSPCFRFSVTFLIQRQKYYGGSLADGQQYPHPS